MDDEEINQQDVLVIDDELILSALKQGFYGVIDMMNQSMVNNADFVLQVLDTYPYAEFTLGEKLVNDELFFKKLIKRKNISHFLKQAHKNILNNIEIMLPFVHCAPRFFDLCGEQIQQNNKLLFKIIKESPQVYEYMPEELKNNPEIIRFTIITNPYYFSKMSESIRSDKNWAKFAISRNAPEVYEYISEELKNNHEFIRFTIKINPYYFSKMSESIRSDKSWAQFAISKRASSLSYVGDELKDDIELVLLAINKNKKMFMYAGEKIKQLVGNNEPVTFLTAYYEKEKLSKNIDEQNNTKKINKLKI